MPKTRIDSETGMLPVVGGRPVEWRLTDSPVAYPDAVADMERRAADIAAGAASEQVWLLEHPPLYTAGTSTRAKQTSAADLPIHPTGRGGQLTYHGPGQRIAYTMLDLRRRSPDVRRFVATLEEWIIRTLAVLNVRGERREDRVGVWVRRPDKGLGHEDKIAAIGIRLSRWVSLHGLALNVACDLARFRSIVSCGVTDPHYGITSLLDLGLRVSVPEVDTVLRREFERLFGPTVAVGLSVHAASDESEPAATGPSRD